MSHFKRELSMRVVPVDFSKEMPIDEQNDLSYEIEVLRDEVYRLMKRLHYFPTSQNVLAKHLIKAEDALNNAVMILRHHYYFDYYYLTKHIKDEK